MVLAITLFACFINGILILLLLSFATICPYKSKKFTKSFFFFPNLLKNPINSACDISFLFLGSVNLSKKCLSVRTISTGLSCLSAYLSIFTKSAIGISLTVPSLTILKFTTFLPFIVGIPCSSLPIVLMIVFLFLNLPVRIVSPIFTGSFISSLTTLPCGFFSLDKSLVDCFLSSFNSSKLIIEYPTNPASLVTCLNHLL